MSMQPQARQQAAAGHIPAFVQPMHSNLESRDQGACLGHAWKRLKYARMPAVLEG